MSDVIKISEINKLLDAEFKLLANNGQKSTYKQISMKIIP